MRPLEILLDTVSHNTPSLAQFGRRVTAYLTESGSCPGSPYFVITLLITIRDMLSLRK